MRKNKKEKRISYKEIAKFVLALIFLFGLIVFSLSAEPVIDKQNEKQSINMSNSADDNIKVQDCVYLDLKSQQIVLINNEVCSNGD